jgi:hypothetical protein
MAMRAGVGVGVDQPTVTVAILRDTGCSLVRDVPSGSIHRAA